MKKNKLAAVIDIGSHALRLTIGESSGKNQVRQVDFLWVPVAIGKDVFSRGLVSHTTITEVIRVLKNFQEVLTSYSVAKYRTVATSSIREASNSDVLMERIRRETGLRIEIIEPAQESEAVYLGIRSILKKRFGFLNKNFVILSVGGGSTRVLIQAKGKIVFSETHHIGTLKLSRDIDPGIRNFPYLFAPYAKNFEQTVHRYLDISSLNGFIAVNDDILTVLEREFPDCLDNSVYVIPRKNFQKFLVKIEELNLTALKDKYQLNDNILKTTKTALLMIGAFYEQTEAESILVPDFHFSLLLVYFLAQEKKDTPESLEEAHENIISSALAIGRKYKFDKPHGQQVSKLSLILFDALRDTYNFPERERYFLETAALLHDIGAFVSASSHNKHSAQLIASSEILGLSSREMKIIGQIARYHRRSLPKPSHFEYMNLRMEERMTVSRLAAILRVADALDSIHTQLVENMTCSLKEEKLTILIHSTKFSGDVLELLRSTVRKKSDLFESFFGIQINLEKY